MKLLKQKKKLKREDLLAVCVAIILMWLFYLDAPYFSDMHWLPGIGISIWCILLGISIYFILTKKSLKKGRTKWFTGVVIISELMISIFSLEFVLAVQMYTAELYPPQGLYLILYLFPFITLYHVFVTLRSPVKLVYRKIDKKSLFFTFIVVLGVLLVTNYFGIFAFIAATMALSTNFVAVRVKDWIITIR